MRYRELDADGDYQFSGNSPWLVNSPACVAQAIETRMRLYVGEWFLDQREGLDKALILGYHTQGTRDQVIQTRIRETPGVLQIVSYSSSVDEERRFSVTVTVDTVYGQTSIEVAF